MDSKDTKSILELKRNIVTIKQNINNLYNICSALYQEIVEIKKFTDFKHDNLSDIDPNNNLTQNITNKHKNIDTNMEILNNIDEYVDNTMKGHKGRKLKIINN